MCIQSDERHNLYQVAPRGWYVATVGCELFAFHRAGTAVVAGSAQAPWCRRPGNESAVAIRKAQVVVSEAMTIRLVINSAGNSRVGVMVGLNVGDFLSL